MGNQNEDHLQWGFKYAGKKKKKKKEIIKTYTFPKMLSKKDDTTGWKENPGPKFKMKVEAQKS